MTSPSGGSSITRSMAATRDCPAARSVRPPNFTAGYRDAQCGSTRVKARALTGGVNWSAVNEALFLLPTQPVRIVEVNYAPVDPPSGSPYAAGRL